MCKAFSCVVNKSGEVFWKLGKDSHEDIIKEFQIKDVDTESICRVEIFPKDYLDMANPMCDTGRKEYWQFIFDNNSHIAPEWWKASHDKACWEACNKWYEEINKIVNFEEARNPINPFKLPEVKKITKKQIKLLIEWDSVWDSVRGSVWGSVWDSVGGSVWDSVWDSVRGSVGGSVWDSVWDSVRGSVGGSVWDSVRDSVRGSVWGYFSSLFKLKFKFDFSSNTKLWKMGLVPSFDGKIWRLHTGEKAKIVYEISQEDLRKMKA